jgi:heat shock protein 1/8
MNTITITNDKGRLSKEDIERMVQEAEKYQKDDEEQRERIESRNKLEGYVYNVKNSLSEQGVKEKLGTDYDIVMSEIEKEMQWLNVTQEASKEEYETHQKDVEAKVMPLLAKLYQGGEGGMPGGMPEGFDPSAFTQSANANSKSAEGPKVEEVD